MTALMELLKAYPELLRGWTSGVEKEGLRIMASGSISPEAHPKSLGSKLCHPYITTDYAENLLELITPPANTLEETEQWLQVLHVFTQKNIGAELIWPCSMPCKLFDEQDIPIAYYGTSNAGRIKTVYRQGLALRYGKLMQMIAGIHYNVSFPAVLLQRATADQIFKNDSELYFHVIRNFIRRQSLVLLFFGASPAFDQSLLMNKRVDPHLERHLDSTWYLPYATSFRMSNLGYHNDAQNRLKLTYNTLQEYISTLHEAISTPYAPYESIGLLDQYGDYQQLTTALLQVENEHYATIRPKQVTLKGERPITALITRGVQYLEVRCLDLDPFNPFGISIETMRFINVMLLQCLLDPSPLMTETEKFRLQEIQQSVTRRGRDNTLFVFDPLENKQIHFHSWVEAELGKLEQTATLLDEAENTHEYSQTIRSKRCLLQNLNNLPSARVLANLHDQRLSHEIFGLEHAKIHRNTYLDFLIEHENEAMLNTLSIQSWREQENLESSDDVVFSDYLNSFLSTHDGRQPFLNNNNN